MRRFLQHVLPKGFQRVRHYGWLGAAAGNKRKRIGALLDWQAPELGQPVPLPPPQPWLRPADVPAGPAAASADVKRET